MLKAGRIRRLNFDSCSLRPVAGMGNCSAQCNISMGGVAGLQRSFSGGTYPCGPLSGTAVLETCSEPLRWLCDHVPVHSL